MVIDNTNPAPPIPSPPQVPLEGLVTARFADLRKNRSLRPEELGIQAFIRAFGPVVLGVASAMLPENPLSPERVVTAVFQTFSRRWRKAPRRVLLAVWLFQTTLVAVRQERKQLRLGKSTSISTYLLGTLYRLPAKFANPVILSALLQVPARIAAAALQLKEKRFANRLTSGLAKLQKSVRKQGGNAEELLRAMAVPLSPEQVEALSAPPANSPAVQPLVRRTISSWRWIIFRAFAKRLLATVGGIASVLLLCAGVFVYLATHGYLMPFFIRMGQQQAVKEFPEMLVPAKPWPVTAEDRALVSTHVPQTSDDFFRTTNIWSVKLTFTPEQWEKIEPSRVPPIRNMFQNNRIILRNPEAKRSGLAGVIGFEFNWTEAHLQFADLAFDKIGVRYRGNGTYLNSLYGQKQSLKLDVAKYVKSNRLAGIHELNLLNAVVDYSYLHDALAEQLFRDLGAVAPRTAYAYVTVDVTGTLGVMHRGLFVALENIDSDFAENRFGVKRTPIFKPVTYDLFQDWGDKWADYEVIYDLKTKATPEQEQRVVDFAKLVSHATDDEFARQLPNFLDLEEFAAFLGGHVLLSSYDGFLVNGQNYYVYLDPRSNKFGFIPWDQDHSWGDFGHIGTNEQREDASIWNPAIYEFHFLKRVMAVEAFREVYRRKLEQALATSFTKQKLYPAIDLLASRIRPAVAAESNFRLERFDKAVSDQWLPGPRDGQAEGPKAPVHQIKRFIENRIQSVREQLDGKSDGYRLTGFR